MNEEGLLLQAAESYGWAAPRDNPYVFAIARDDDQDDALAARLQENGFEVLRLPLLETAPGRDASRLSARLEALEPGTAIAWTSRRAGEALAAAWRARSGTPARTPLFALGDVSAAPVTALGMTVATPQGWDPPTARALADLVATRVKPDGIGRVLFLAGNRSLPDFPDALREHGVAFETLEVYETRFRRADVDPLLRALVGNRLACLIVMSPSGAEALEALLLPDALDALHRVPVAAKGATTAAALRGRGFRSVDAGLRTLTPRAPHPLAFLALHHMGAAR